MALPSRLGGIALTNPTSIAEVEFSASTKVSDPLKDAILHQCFEYQGDVIHEQVEAKGEVRRMKQCQGRRSRSRRYHSRGTNVGSKTYESHYGPVAEVLTQQ